MDRFSRAFAALALIVVLTLGLAGCTTTGDALLGTNWRLTGWGGTSIDPTSLDSIDIASGKITANFDEGRVSGNSGVNTYSGAYKVTPAGSFSAGPIAATEMAGPEPAMRAESAYLTLLGQAKSYEVVGSQLTLLGSNGDDRLVFERSD
jgi:heat shock protein HslJ